jgi:hypothetical protein
MTRSSQKDAAIAASSHLFADDSSKFSVRAAPPPEAVNWTAVWTSRHKRIARKWFAVILYSAAIIFPIGFFVGACRVATVPPFLPYPAHLKRSKRQCVLTGTHLRDGVYICKAIDFQASNRLADARQWLSASIGVQSTQIEGQCQARAYNLTSSSI